MEKRWTVKQQGDGELVNRLSDELNIDQTLSNLLVQRGIGSYDEAKRFFRPELSDLHDPFVMKDMHLAVERLERAVKNNEKILIYGDYDVDGTTSVALVFSFLREFHQNIEYYIPDRYAEGYGISYQSIDFAYENGFSLVIALDCGIKAVEKIKKAKGFGIDFIICDHHRPGDSLPPAHAILDPKRSDCPYPYKDLSGCGVGFKLIQAYAQKTKMDESSVLRYLDLVVVSIASDIVKITGENRILAHYGLKLINLRPRPGFEAILYYANIKKIGEDDGTKTTIYNKELTVNDLVFMVGPRINAAGRIKTARNSVELLISRNIEASKKIAQDINTLNSQRRDLDLHTYEEALHMISHDKHLMDSKSTVVYNPEWHKGIIGIVASRLTDVYYRPTIVLTKSNGLLTGSARSVKDFDIYDAIDSCSDLLEHFGGHKYAAGLALKPENLELFTKRFEQYVIDNITDQMLIPEIEIDSPLDVSKINEGFFKVLKQFAPFGPGNMSPVFMTPEVNDFRSMKIVGSNHLKMTISPADNPLIKYDAIAFQQGEQKDFIVKTDSFAICYHIEENHWMGKTNLQLNIKDIKVTK